MLGASVIKVDYDLLVYPVFPSGHGPTVSLSPETP